MEIGILDAAKNQEIEAYVNVPTSASEEENPELISYQSYNHDKKLTFPLPCIASNSNSEYRKACLKGCKWAPDGTCLLTNSEDSTIRLFSLPQSLYDVQTKDNFTDNWMPSLKIKEGGQIYDYAWYPYMNSSTPGTSCFLTCAVDNPIHLWDAFTGELRASYIPFNYADQIVSAHSVAFDAFGEKIYAGFSKSVRIFDVSRPGRLCKERKKTTSILPDLNLHSIISCIAVSPIGTIYACASYSKGVGIYLEDGTTVCVLQGHLGGVTHLKFNSQGSKLFSGGRKDNRLFCWDMRNLGTVYEVFDREVTTNQRIYFDLSPDDRYLVSGGTDGVVKIWDLTTGALCENEISSRDEIKKAECQLYEFPASSDCVNGVSLNPCLPLLATASGQRYFSDLSDSEESENIFTESKSKFKQKFSVNLFNFI